MAVKVVKMCDMPIGIATKVFVALNPGKVTEVCTHRHHMKIITNTEPMDLTYPEGWYYAKGTVRHKHQSTTGFYSEVDMLTEDGVSWRDKATYCTLNN